MLSYGPLEIIRYPKDKGSIYNGFYVTHVKLATWIFHQILCQMPNRKLGIIQNISKYYAGHSGLKRPATKCRT